MKRLVSRVLARRVVVEVEQICGLKMPLESTRQLVEQQNWRKIAYITADCFVVRPLRRWMKRCKRPAHASRVERRSFD